MKVDEALHLANPLGRVQFFIFACNCSIMICAAWINLGSVFFAESISYKCVTKNPETGFKNVSSEEFEDSFCQNNTNVCPGGFKYDTSEHGRSIISEWHLVCDGASLSSVSLSVLHAGQAVGAVLFGYTTDKYGRRSTMMLCLVFFNIFSLAETWSPNYIFFVIMRFLCGLTFKGTIMSPIIALLECLTPKHRSVVGSFPQTFFSLGLAVLPGVGYLVKDWRPYRAVLMVPSMVCLAFFWILPESVRWQIAKNKVEDAERTIQEIAKWNGVKNFPEKVFIEGEANERNKEGQKWERKLSKYRVVKEIIKPPTSVVTTCLGVMWFAFFVVYFGFSLSSGSLVGNFYLNFFLISLVEIPARLLHLCIIGRISRVISSFLCFSVAGLTMTAIVFLRNFNNEWGSVISVLAFLGKMFISVNYATVLLMTAEVFPTTMRVAGTGFVHACGSFGSICAPLLLYLETILPNFAFTCMAAISFLAALLSCFLPDTLNTVQPQTVEDLKELMRTKYIVKTIFNTRNKEGDQTYM